MDPGTAIRCETSKWGDRPHWQFDGFFLGSDEHGDWLGSRRAPTTTAPGYEFHSDVDAVTLVPSEGWYAATFHQPGIWCDLYVDVATPGRWDGNVLRMVDLDLDVIRHVRPAPRVPPRRGAGGRTPAGEVFVDDEDEFAEHQVPTATPPTSSPRAGQLRRARPRASTPACRRTTARTSAGWRSSLV